MKRDTKHDLVKELQDQTSALTLRMCSDVPARFVAVDFFRSEPGGVLYTPRGRPGVAPRAGLGTRG